MARESVRRLLSMHRALVERVTRRRIRALLAMNTSLPRKEYLSRDPEVARLVLTASAVSSAA